MTCSGEAPWSTRWRRLWQAGVTPWSRVSRSAGLWTVMPSPSRSTRPLKRSTLPVVWGVQGLVRRGCTFSSRQVASTAWAGKQAAAVGEPVGDLDGGCGDRLVEEGHGAARPLVVPEGQVPPARGAVDGQVEDALAALAIGGLEPGEGLDVPVEDAEVTVLERGRSRAGAGERAGLSGSAPRP